MLPEQSGDADLQLAQQQQQQVRQPLLVESSQPVCKVVGAVGPFLCIESVLGAETSTQQWESLV